MNICMYANGMYVCMYYIHNAYVHYVYTYIYVSDFSFCYLIYLGCSL